MKILDNKLFPTKRDCKHCNSTILIENENECEYVPESESYFFYRKECLIWKCPICKKSNKIYLKH